MHGNGQLETTQVWLVFILGLFFASGVRFRSDSWLSDSLFSFFVFSIFGPPCKFAAHSNTNDTASLLLFKFQISNYKFPMPELRRSIKLPHATAMVVGIIVGASIFTQPSEITRLVPNTSGILLVWLAAGLLTLCGALVCAELASVFPQTGGVYVFLKETFSPALGFLWGWAMFWSVHSGILAAIAVVLARYVAYFHPLNEAAIRSVAIGAILLLSVINYLGVKSGSLVQLVLTVAKLAAIVAMVILLFWFGGDARNVVHFSLWIMPLSTKD